MKTKDKGFQQGILFISLIFLTFNYISYQCLGLELKMTMRMISVIILFAYAIFNLDRLKLQIGFFAYFITVIVTMIYNPNAKLNFIFILLFVISTINQKVEETIFIIKQSAVCGLIMYFVLKYFGFIQDVITVSQDGRVRNSLGFANVNSASAFFFSTSILLILASVKPKLINWILAGTILCFCVIQTKTRTVIITGFLFFFIYIMLNKISSFSNYTYKNEKRISACIRFMVKCISITPFLFPLILKCFPKLDYLLSLRLSIATRFINSLSPINIIFGGVEKEIDNSYLVFFSKYGIVVSIWTIIIIGKAIGNLLKQGKMVYLSFLMTMLMNGLSESDFIRPELMTNIAFWIIIFRYAYYENSRDIYSFIYEKVS